jgi:hypothetical protein
MCRLYHLEFLLPKYKNDKDVKFDESVNKLLTETLKYMTEAKLISPAYNGYKAKDIGNLKFLATLLNSYHEIYHSTLIVARQRFNNEITGDITQESQKRFNHHLKIKNYKCNEEQNRITFQTAFNAIKDLKLNRPGKDERPFDKGQIGFLLIEYLETALKI